MLTPIATVMSHHGLKLGLALALGLRLGYALLVPNEISRWRDGLSYDNIAMNLISGAGYRDETGEWPGEPPYADPSAPTARWMPGYPLFLAGIYSVFGHSYRAVYIAQAVLGGAIAAFVFLLARPIVGFAAGVLAVFLYAADPFSLYLAGRFQTEQLFAFLLVASLYCFLRMRHEGRINAAFGAAFGVLAGAAALTRTVAGLMFGGLCLAALVGLDSGFARVRLRSRIVVLAIASVAFLGVLGPWVIRNHRVTGKYILSTEAWQTLAMTNNDRGGIEFSRDGLSAMPRTSIAEREVQREEVYQRAVTEWIAKHPWRFARLFVLRAVMFWSPEVKTLSGAQAALGLAFNLLILGMSAWCVVAYRRQWRRLAPIYVVLVSFTAGYSLVASLTRFRVPLNPLLAILAAAGVVAIVAATQRFDRAVDGSRPQGT